MTKYQKIYNGDNHFDHYPTTTKHEHDIELDNNLLERESDCLRDLCQDSVWQDQQNFPKVPSSSLQKASVQVIETLPDVSSSRLKMARSNRITWKYGSLTLIVLSIHPEIFFLHNLDSSKPSIPAFTEAAAALHKSRTSTTGHFGFHVTEV